MRRIAASLGAVLLVCVLAWLFGFNFNERGFAAGYLGTIAIYAAGLIYFCPLWNK